MNTSFISIKAKEEEGIERKNGELWFAGTTNSCGFPCQNCMKVPLITMLGGGGEQLEMRMAHALYRKSNLCIPGKGLALPKSQILHSCVCERFIYSQEWSTYLDAAI
jgi:hypothetical protein